jgi:hypothetical protein
MKKIYLFAACAALFAACTSDDQIIDQQPAQIEADGAVMMGAYMQRSTTRAGLTGDETNAKLQGAYAEFGGFGVFGYYTDNKDYDQLAQPNFFYNQKVTYNTTDPAHWEYSPVKYWPNEYGNNAISDDNDRVSYFAYAPYVDVTASTGKTVLREGAQSAYETALDTYNTAKTTYLAAKNTYDAILAAGEVGHPTDEETTAFNSAVTTWNDAKKTYNGKYAEYVAAGGAEFGIVGMNRNTASGDPVIKYQGSFNPAEAVDLCWGVSQQAQWPLVNGEPAQKIAVGKPWLNVQRPSQTSQEVTFNFRHALAKMQVKIDAFVDGTAASTALDANTRIWVRSVKFNGFAMKGALNLNNETANQPYWMNFNGIGDLESDGEVIIYDGRKDGKEAVQGATATNEKTLGLNEQLVEDETAFAATNVWAAAPTGVTKTEQYLFAGANATNNGIFYVIPTGDNMQVEIIYDVETISKNLGFLLADNSSQGSSIENRIQKSISFGDTQKLEPGKAYTIKLHLGMNSVEFEANVVGWEDVAPADVDLPANVPFFTAAAAGTGAATIPAVVDKNKFLFGINGLNGGELVNTTVGANKWNSATNVLTSTTAYLTGWSSTADALSGVNANSSGYMIETLTTTNNPTTVKRTQIVTWTGKTSNNKVEVTFTQEAAPLKLLPPSPTTAGETAQLRRDVTSAPAYGYFCTEYAAATFAAPLTTNGNPENGQNGIRVWRNGTELQWVSSFTADPGPIYKEFTFDDNGLITFKEALVNGDVIRVMLKTGDAPAETITWTVGL